jgi:hypothetical protein
MPNWKKLITSGSAGSLASLSVDTSVEASSFTGSLLSTNGVLSSSAQLDGFVSASGGFTVNETIIATGTNSVTSSNILALDTTNNYLGINQSNPEVTLHMTGEDAQTAQIRMEQYNNSADAPDIRTRRYRGTSASPLAVNSGDYLFRSNHEYWNGTSLITGGSFAFDNTNNAARTQFAVAVDKDGTGADILNDKQLLIDGNDSGAITFNEAYKFPTSDGNANEVLTSDGNGTLTFSNPIPASTVSSSAQIATDISGSITSTSSSIASDIASLVSFSSSFEATIYNYTGSFTGDGSALTGITSDISETATIADTFSNQTSVVTEHNFGTKNVQVTVYDDNDAMIIPDSIVTTDTNNITTTFDSSTSGRVVVGKAGHIVSGSTQSYRQSITGASTYAVTHSLAEDYPIVQVYSSSRAQVIPSEIITTSANALDITFTTTFNGTVVVKK